MNILALNAGSSSLKYKLIRCEGTADVPLEHGVVELAAISSDEPAPSETAKAAETKHNGGPTERSVLESGASSAAPGITSAVEDAVRACQKHGIDALAFRVVHGGSRFVEPVRITDEVVKEIDALTDLAPLHNPPALRAIRAGGRLLPATPAVAVFDTSFHSTLPPVASEYALPANLASQLGLRRYGFHGISHRYISEVLLGVLKRNAVGSRLITCHLGNGASVCAIQDGMSIDTSMGMTPLEGLVMGTRCGDIDPGLILHVLRKGELTVEQLDDVLEHQSGLKGISGLSADVRDLESAACSGNAAAELALQTFAYRVRKYIGAYAAALNGVDALALSGGIGEHSQSVRASICSTLGWLGITLDTERNAAASGGRPCCISTTESAVSVWVIPTDEERQIIRESCVLLQREGVGT